MASLSGPGWCGGLSEARRIAAIADAAALPEVGNGVVTAPEGAGLAHG